MATATQERTAPWPVLLYRSALGKKYVMAITGIVWLGFVIGHLVGNTKLYFGADTINYYGEWLREGLGYPLLPHRWTLWLMRGGLIAALALHVHAAWALTRMNQKARGSKYQAGRDYIAVDFAGKTMRYTGVVVLLYLGYHLADLTWGWLNPNFVPGDVYGNLIASLSNPAVALIYVVANIALGAHLAHGLWSLFQTLGINNRKFNAWRGPLAKGLAGAIVLGNLSFPIVIATGIVSEDSTVTVADREARVDKVLEKFE